MTALIIALGPLVSNWVTSLLKHMTPLSEKSALFIRATLAIIAVVAAVLEALVFGQGQLPSNFTDLLTTAALAVVNFLGATGVFHLGTSPAK